MFKMCQSQYIPSLRSYKLLSLFCSLLSSSSLQTGSSRKAACVCCASTSVCLTVSGSAACSGSSASSELGTAGEPGAASRCRSCGCRNGHGWPEPCPEDHCGESLLSCRSGCSASGKTWHHTFLKVVLEGGVVFAVSVF